MLWMAYLHGQTYHSGEIKGEVPVKMQEAEKISKGIGNLWYEWAQTTCNVVYNGKEQLIGRMMYLFNEKVCMGYAKSYLDSA